MKKNVFLSHSSQDKHTVKNLAEQLKNRNVHVWLDEWEIDVGDSIPAKVQEGLEKADFVAVWLTPNSVNSGWVTTEWQTKIYNQISTQKTQVLPLLGENCDIPLFLSDKKYADFRISFKEGFSTLMKTLSRQNFHDEFRPAVDEAHFTVAMYVNGFLKDLEDACIPFPTIGNLHIVSTLKSIPRSGKFLRLDSMEYKIPIRSIYDHILSVAHSADCLIDLLNPPPPITDNRNDLGRVITYHDLCEVVIGDVPQFTPLNRTKRRRAHISAQIQLSKLPNGYPEEIVNKFIGLYLTESARQSLITTTEIMERRTNVWKFAYALDKIDPIIAVWRYINHFRNDPKFDIDDFLERMRHFFDNPQVKKAVSSNIKDQRAVELVEKLQNRSKARQYYIDKTLLSDELFSFPAKDVRNLIEGIELQFVKKRIPRPKQTKPRAAKSKK